MLRIRSIHYDAFKSHKLAALSAEAERCWWRLQCLCDDAGRVEDDPEVIVSMLFPRRRDFTPEDVDGWLAEMAGVGLILRYEAVGGTFLAINQWPRFQKPRRPQESKLPPPDLSGSVGTRPAPSGSVSLERRGVEQEGESEGETSPSTEPVDNVATIRALREAL